MERKTDRRSIKTQTALKNALAVLIKDKPLQEITVAELTVRADIHRATFYSHYEDIFDLYRDFENDILGKLTGIFDDEALTSYQSFYSALLDYIAQNPLWAKAVISASEQSMQSLLFQDIVEYLLSACMEAWRRENKGMEITPQIEYFAQFRVHGIIAMIGHWIHTDYSISLTELKAMIAGLDQQADSFIVEYFK